MADAPKATHKRRRKGNDSPESAPAATIDTTSLEARMAAIESRIADQDPRAMLTEFKATLAEMQGMLLELRQDVPRLAAQAPQPLSLEQIQQIIEDDKQATFVSLSNDRPTGLRAGESFRWPVRFKNQAAFLSHCRRPTFNVCRGQ